MNKQDATLELSDRLDAWPDLSSGAKRDLCQPLNILLADMFALYVKTKNFHRHVAGPHFRDYHLPPDEQATQIYRSTDTIAERVRKIGGRTLRSIGLTDHKPIEADYDVRCDGYHSGNRITHNARNGVENSGDVGCYESDLSPKPWGPATEVRIALVDPDRGIVIGYSILQYGDRGRAMQINEIFKILDGRIRMTISD